MRSIQFQVRHLLWLVLASALVFRWYLVLGSLVVFVLAMILLAAAAFVALIPTYLYVATIRTRMRSSAFNYEQRWRQRLVNCALWLGLVVAIVCSACLLGSIIRQWQIPETARRVKVAGEKCGIMWHERLGHDGCPNESYEDSAALGALGSSRNRHGIAGRADLAPRLVAFVTAG